LLGHPGRSLFSILGVAVGIATVVAVFTLDHVTLLSRIQHLDPDYGADMEVRAAEDSSDPRAELLKMEGVAGVATFFQSDVGFRPRVAAGDVGTERIRLVGLEAEGARSLGVYFVEEGQDLSASEAGDGVLIGRSLADHFRLGLGDRVLLSQPRNAAKKKCVEGALTEVQSEDVPARQKEFRVLGILGRDGIGRRAKGRMVVVDFDAGRELLKDAFIESQFWVKRSDTVDIEAMENSMAKNFTFERNQAKAVGQMADERAFRNGVRLAGLFALLLGLFVIFHTLSMSLIERVGEVGSLHSLGATRFQIAKVFLTEALVIAVSAGVLGLAGGVGLAALLLRRGISTLGVTGRPVGPFQVPWDSVMPLVLLGVGMALVGSVYPILRIKGANLVSALRNQGEGEESMMRGFQLFSTLLLVAVVPLAFFQVVPVIGAAEGTLVGTMLLGLLALGLLIGLPMIAPRLVGRVAASLARPFVGPFPLVGKLVTRTLEGSAGRIGSSIAAIALVTAAFVGLKGMTQSLLGEVEDWGQRAAVDKVWVECLPELPFDEVARVLHELPEVECVENGDARAFPSFLIFGSRPEELGGFGPLAEEPELRRRFEEEQTIVVSERLARQNELTPGDVVRMRTSGHGVQAFEVLVVSDAYGYFVHPDERAYGLVHERFLERYFCVDASRTTSIAVKLKGGDRELVLAALRARWPGAQGQFVYTGESVMRLLLDDIRVDFVLFDIIMLLTAILAGLGVLNGQLLAAMERKKELGVLRALGTTRGQIAGVVMLESGLIGLIGGVLGALVGTGLTPVMVSSLRVLSGLDLPLRSAGGFLFFALGAALVLSLMAGIYPIWRMNRFDAVRAVRTG